MFKLKPHPVEGGTIYTQPFKESVFVPEKQGLNEKEKVAQERLIENLEEHIKLLQEAVHDLLKVHVCLSSVKYEENVLEPLEVRDPRILQTIDALRAAEYITTTNENGYLCTRLAVPGKILTIFDELGVDYEV